MKRYRAVEREPVGAPKPGEIRAARPGPLRVVIAGDDVVGDGEPVEDLLGQAEVLHRCPFR